ncbi:MAG: hypothetical protein HUU06_05370 [Planctomycetaceae bacterium]|nr:hypothetical protein [Planctomycetaceae bacterium]
MKRSGEIRIHDSTVGVWEDQVETKAFQAEVFDPLIRFLRSRGWRVKRDPQAHRHYRTISKWHRYCRRGDLEANLQLMGRSIGFELYQNVANVTHPSGGKYEFDKMGKMPYLLRNRARLTIRDVVAHLTRTHGYSVRRPDPGRPGPGNLTGRQWILSQACDWHFKPDLGRAAYTNGDLDRRGGDGSLIDHGQVVWFRGYDGRIGRGVAYYNLNNMWWVLSGKWTVYNVPCWDLYTSPPEDLRTRRFSEAHCYRRVAENLARAVKAMDFEKAARIKPALLRFGPSRVSQGIAVEPVLVGGAA